MYKCYCDKCGSINLFINKINNNTGLYCKDCGTWIKWLSKNELMAFKNENKDNENNNYSTIKACCVCGEGAKNLDTPICDKCIAAIKWARETMEKRRSK